MRLLDYAPRPAHLRWLLDSDPAIRWQVMRDLTAEAPAAIAAERSRIATEGWGAQLLAVQSPAGHWRDPVTVAQGTRIGRQGRLFIRRDDNTGIVWVGGQTCILIEGTLTL